MERNKFSKHKRSAELGRRLLTGAALLGLSGVTALGCGGEGDVDVSDSAALKAEPDSCMGDEGFETNPATGMTYVQGMQNAADLNCTSNDVAVAATQLVSGPVECLEGETISIEISADLESNSQSRRSDIGIWLAADGGAAITGACTHFYFVDPELEELDTVPDGCRDIGAQELFPMVPLDTPQATLDVVCRDEDNDGFLDVGSCIGWKVPGDDQICPDEPNGTFVKGTLPANKAKCRCSNIEVPIIVKKTAKIEVVKDLDPMNDPGLFNLFIEDVDDNTVGSATDVGDGGTTGIVIVPAGTNQAPGADYTVGETAGTDTSLDFYTISIECVDRDTTNVRASGSDAGPLSVSVLPNDDIVCTVLNERIPLPDVAVMKDANSFFIRTWTWEIDKSADQTDIIINAPNQMVDVNYEVKVSATSLDSDHEVTGTITIEVSNIGPYEGTFTVTDDADGTAATVDCGGGQNTFAVSVNGITECTYSAITSTGGTNTATVDVTWNSGDTDQATATADFAFETPNDEIDETVAVNDTNAEFGDEQTCTGTTPTMAMCLFEYVIPVTCPGFNDFTIPNTADFETNDTATTGSDDWLVNVACPPPPDQCVLTQGYWKTHSLKGPVPEKKADDTWLQLPYGPDTVFFLSGQTYYDVLWTPPKGNAYYNLAHQYIAAQLNDLADGSLNSDGCEDAMYAFLAATDVFNTYTPDEVRGFRGPKRRNLISLAGTLANFNEGYLCHPSCTEDADSAP